MTANEIIELTKRVRAVQKEYFRTRSYEALNTSRRLEKELDTALESYGQAELFGN